MVGNTKKEKVVNVSGVSRLSLPLSLVPTTHPHLTTNPTILPTRAINTAVSRLLYPILTTIHTPVLKNTVLTIDSIYWTLTIHTIYQTLITHIPITTIHVPILSTPILTIGTLTILIPVLQTSILITIPIPRLQAPILNTTHKHRRTLTIVLIPIPAALVPSPILTIIPRPMLLTVITTTTVPTLNLLLLSPLNVQGIDSTPSLTLLLSSLNTPHSHPDATTHHPATPQILTTRWRSGTAASWETYRHLLIMTSLMKNRDLRRVHQLMDCLTMSQHHHHLGLLPRRTQEKRLQQ